MGQAIKNLSTKNIKELISKRFVDALQEYVSHADGKISDTMLASRLEIPRSGFSKIKSNDGYYATLEMLFSSVNKLGLNANRIFKQDNSKEATFLDQSVHMNVPGNNNQVNNQKGKVNSVIHSSTGGDITIAESIVQNIADPKARKEAKKQFDKLAGELEVLKKMTDLYKKQIDEKDSTIRSDKKVIETQEKLIAIYEAQQKTKKTKK